MSKEVLAQAQDKMTKSEQALQHQLGSIRAGRANASLLDRVSVDYYGAPTPINQVAGVSVPEARLLMISPYDKTALGDIEKAILKADLGIMPNNDGEVIRIAIPQLTEERRKELVKEVKKEAEDAKVAVRNVRRDANDDLKKLEKSGDITEDDLRNFTEDVQKLTDASIKKLDEIAKSKEEEIMEV
ncbi:ribosome recycling factor [Listeria newyorkensis]|uniref:Ribosome-recycling factor n=1 Tax=Listeria newyorkensis TaxID=1497681 RepID=A0ABX4XNN6_9LIST|nr:MULTISPECIES: ribosome recycling factor [Listeria]KGL45162.1 ribosome recycling factor [Listeriaceae bacterium FSL A5-0209]KGL40056.1 ribosome recycling factor [Listeria newyorkensis]PNP93338.1 ribosome recycling factor [Listeria newyorkensis]RQW68203.1 ribosome recycling factor [Listeria sp. SHR_NRA_18]WAO21219.1 ribosome recycling factor [Listeria newyorkensis]